MKGRVAFLTDEDAAIWHIVGRRFVHQYPLRGLVLIVLYMCSYPSDNCDARIMDIAQAAPLAWYVSARGEASMVREGNDFYAVRRSYDPFYSNVERDC